MAVSAVADSTSTPKVRRESTDPEDLINDHLATS